MGVQESRESVYLPPRKPAEESAISRLRLSESADLVNK